MKAVSILSKFFGRKEGQTLAEFAAEIKQLSKAEKDELCILAAEGLEVVYDDVPQKGE